MPYDAVDNRHTVCDGDIVVMGSDGVFDNLFDSDIIACIKRHDPNLEHIADCIATYAEIVSYDESYESPYTVAAVKHGKPRE